MYNYSEQHNKLIILSFCLYIITIKASNAVTGHLSNAATSPIYGLPRTVPNYFHTVNLLGYLVPLIRSPCYSGHLRDDGNLKWLNSDDPPVNYV